MPQFRIKFFDQSHLHYLVLPLILISLRRLECLTNEAIVIQVSADEAGQSTGKQPSASGKSAS